MLVTRLIKTNLTKTNTDIVDKNFKTFDMQHKSSESFVHDSISVELFNNNTFFN